MGDYQYYNPVSVDNGVIGTIQNDEGVPISCVCRQWTQSS